MEECAYARKPPKICIAADHNQWKRNWGLAWRARAFVSGGGGQRQPIPSDFRRWQRAWKTELASWGFGSTPLPPIRPPPGQGDAGGVDQQPVAGGHGLRAVVEAHRRAAVVPRQGQPHPRGPGGGRAMSARRSEKLVLISQSGVGANTRLTPGDTPLARTYGE